MHVPERTGVTVVCALVFCCEWNPLVYRGQPYIQQVFREMNLFFAEREVPRDFHHQDDRNVKNGRHPLEARG